jgi:hypothetical protein
VTHLIDKFDNYDFLPISLEVFNAKGKSIYPNSALGKDFYNSFKEYLYFEAYIDSHKVKTPIFTTKNKDKKLGAHLKVENGHLLVFPMLNLDIDDLYDFENEVWKKEAIDLGKKFKSSLVNIDKQIRSGTSKTPKSDWLKATQYRIASAQKTRDIIEKNNIRINQLIKENDKLRTVLNEQESIQDLLFETGKPLELAVIKALKLLDYAAENYNNGILELDQIIVSPEKDRYIGECEGKDTKEISVGKFRQLLDSLNEDFEREEVKEKALGLIFGNPQRLIQIEKRSTGFTEKCLRGAKRERIGLILTSDLFFVSKYLTCPPKSDPLVILGSKGGFHG